MSWKDCRRPLAFALALASMCVLAAPALADDITPPPPSVGTNVPASYFGPFPSQIDRKLVGPVQLLRSGPLNMKTARIKIPLYLGHMADGRNVWYILTDTNDERNAEALGLNFSAKLAYAEIGSAVRHARLNEDAALVFDAGAVDFTPVRNVVPGAAPNFFPPKSAQPGSVGDKDYTPIVKIDNADGFIYNAPVVAFGVEADKLQFCRGKVDYNLVHDRVLKICPEGRAGGTVTLQMTPIFSFGRAAAYISTEASDPVVAALDNGTFAPALADVPVGSDDGAFSAVERLFPIANGPTGADNPQRQGLNSALSDVGTDGKPLPPLHVIGGIPTLALDYSPLWDLNLGEWTKDAIDEGYRSRMIDEFQLLEFVRRGFITGPGGEPFGSTGIVVNCPIIMRFL